MRTKIRSFGRWMLPVLALLVVACGGTSGAGDGGGGGDGNGNGGGGGGGPQPIDVIVAVDNSADMGEEVQALLAQINSFAAILDGASIDWRMILVSKYGTGGTGVTETCVPPPLGGAACGGPVPVNSARFFHYSTSVASHDLLCKLFDGFTAADEFNLTPTGWSAWVRADAFKVFVVVTTDGVSCTSSGGAGTLDDMDTVVGGMQVSMQFRTALLGLSAAQFGSAGDPRFAFFGLLGVVEKMPASPMPYADPDAVTTSMCASAADPGTGFQALCKDTQGAWYPICVTGSYDAILADVATRVLALAGP